MKKPSLFVAGSFDDNCGKPSKIAQQVFEAVKSPGTAYYNGGSFQSLQQIIEDIEQYRLVFWFADVPNDKPKLVNEIKQKNKECVLVTSKRNVDGKYTFEDLTYRALGIKSNLFVEFIKENDRYKGRVADPLGNVFLDYSEDFSRVGKALGKRAYELLRYTRVPSSRFGDKTDVPDEDLFFRIVKDYADVFHGLVHAHPEATNRFFGNASFRSDNNIFVTRRNVDKREAGKDMFVGVKKELPVQYLGESKPSVDAPVQIELYNQYPFINYMIHSHTYIKGAPFTSSIIPCGALEEVREIASLFPYKEELGFNVNLLGHGSLALSSKSRWLRGIHHVARAVPEVHDYFKWK
ncbi:MAG: class II aldolase/adducin family protein [archaeon]